MQEVVSEDGKTRAIIAHITIIGWIIALLMNNESKDSFASFYIRQSLGLFLSGLAISFTGILGPYIISILSLAVFAFLIYSLIGAIQEERRLVPVLGPLFQDWFKNL